MLSGSLLAGILWQQVPAPLAAATISWGRHSEVEAAFVRRCTGAGEPVWTSAYANPRPAALEGAYALAFGPDFLIGLGHTVSGRWVRRFAID